MGSSSETKEQTMASEKYQPALNDYYNGRFKRLVEQMSHKLPINRADIIKRELDQIDIDNSDDQLETLKYASSLSVLIDLSLQGWIFDIDEGTLTLKMENENLDDKQKLRYRLSAEKNAQFKTPSVAAFIRQMESKKNYQGNNISVSTETFLLEINDFHMFRVDFRNYHRYIRCPTMSGVVADYRSLCFCIIFFDLLDLFLCHIYCGKNEINFRSNLLYFVDIHNNNVLYSFRHWSIHFPSATDSFCIGLTGRTWACCN